jgi:hypothetical protein
VIVVDTLRQRSVVAMLGRRELMLSYGREMSRLEDTDHRDGDARNDPF